PLSGVRLTILSWGDPGVPLASLLHPFGDQHYADCLRRRSKIQKQRLTGLWCHQYWQRGEVLLQFLEGMFSLFGPRKWTGPPQELEEGEGSLSQPRYEAAKSSERSSKLLDVLDAARRPHRFDRLDLGWVCLDASMQTRKPSSFPC